MILTINNYSNITCLLNRIIHKGGQIVVKVYDGCIILFTNNAIHTRHKSCIRNGGTHISHIRVFSYIVEIYVFK